jgi:diguanylate cyclase (GGDEF)-like protein
VFSSTLVVLIVLDHYAKKYALEQANTRLQQLAWQMRDAIDRGMHERFIDMRLLATAESSIETRKTDALRRLFEELKDSQPHYAWMGKVDPTGKVLVATGGLLEGVDVSQRPWFQGARQASFAGDYHPALLLEKKLPQQADPWRFIDIALPLRDEDGRLRGVIGAHLSWGWARDIAARLLDPTQQDYQVQILIVRKDSTVLLGPRHFEEQKVTVPSLGAALAGRSGTLREAWPDGDFITGYARTNAQTDAGLGWAILIRQPAQVALLEYAELERTLLIATGIVAVLLALLAALFARRLAQPLTQLSTAIEQRTKEGEDTPLPLISGYREVHLLSNTLANLIALEKRQRHALSALNQSLENEVNERTAELRAAADQLQSALIEQSTAKEQLQQMVLLDMLTGLPNRRAFHEELPKAMARAQRDNHDLAVLFLDLDGFKAVNDTHGHEAGDELLRQFAARISACVRKTDMVARLAGDEFVVILERLVLASDASDVASKIRHEMAAAFDLGTARVTLSSSVGIALFAPNGTQSPNQLIHAADQAMYVAKHAGKNRIHVASYD